MIPVKQTQFAAEVSESAGNCMAACFASIFELDLDDVPNFAAVPGDGYEWWDAVQDWLRGRGYFALVVEDEKMLSFRYPTYTVVSGKSPRGDFEHVVVYRNGQMVHDPHPSKDGIETVTSAWFLVPLNPSKMRLT